MTTHDYMLSTIDNPFNPWNNFDEWYSYDIHAGHNTLGYLARIAKVSSDMSDDVYNEATNAAIDEIVKLNPTGFYIRVFPETDTIAIAKVTHKELKEMNDH